VLVTNGGKHAVFTAFAALCDPGDEVICPAPYWTTYPEAITLAGGVPVVIATDESTDFKVTVDQLEAARTDRTKAILFVSPDEPVGRRVHAGRDQGDRRMGRRARHLGDHRRDLRAPHLRRPHEHSSMRDAGARAARQCLILNGVAKTYAMTGWRVGWMIGPNDIDQGRHQLPEPRHVERGQRRPACRARCGVRGGSTTWR
jgi:aspartate aminotransferase